MQITRIAGHRRGILVAITSAAVAGSLVTAAPAAHAAAVRHARPAPVLTPAKGSPWALPTVDSDHDGDIDQKDVCAPPARVGWATCFAVKLIGMDALSPSAIDPFAPAGYGPGDLQKAYGLNATLGSGRTVAIVDAYDDPNAASDLAAYRRMYGLPVCTTANGCFRKVSQTGTTRYPQPNAGWAGEISLDLDMVSATCPRCKILLVEASNSSMTNLGTAVNEAVNLGAKYVSNSYGGSESSADTTYDTRYFNHPGVALTVSTGDGGYGTAYPSTSRYVVAVGGTSLTRASGTTRGWRETAWAGAGSGCSAYDSKPAWQKDTGCRRRSVADVSAVADPDTGVAVYNTYRSSGWQVYGGTSASAPIIASVYAMAGVPATGSYPASYIYAKPSSLYDVTSGSNGSCSSSYLCRAQAGYDGPTGLGTPKGTAAFTSTAGGVSCQCTLRALRTGARHAVRLRAHRATRTRAHGAAPMRSHRAARM